jgi:hypothetical protein
MYAHFHTFTGLKILKIVQIPAFTQNVLSSGVRKDTTADFDGDLFYMGLF